MKAKFSTRVVPQPEVAQSIGFALSELPPIEQDAVQQELLASDSSGRGRLAVVETTSNGKRCGAMAAWLLPGKSATVWPPHVAGEPSGAVIVSLNLALERELQAAGIFHAQAVLPAAAQQPAEYLAACNFHWAADLLYMVCDEAAFPSARPSHPFQLVPYANHDIERLIALIDATYENTLDCPALNNLRSTRDVLAGYRAAGEYRPEWWFCVEHDENPVGCLLLADYPQSAQVELIYFGLTSEFRGRGWGELLVRAAQFLAGQAERKRMVLAVDVRNKPAIDAYLRCGFEEWDRRAVWLKVLGPMVD